ncbi:MAG: HD domain-containing protein [Actinobacteria bacterium]|nr:HD domain-containing protein [Actinomycetota bacterium]
MDALRKAFSAAHPEAAIETIERAYTVAAHAHRAQLRKSGDPYITHPLAVAMIVIELGMSPEAVCAALLHDTVDDKAADTCTLSQLRDDFGEETAALVNEVCRLDDPKYAEEKLGYAEAAIRSNPDDVLMLQSLEAGALVIKLADRLHNMRTMRYLAPARQRLKSIQTLRVHAPLANIQPEYVNVLCGGVV